MKKILLFLFFGAVGFTAYSCDNKDDVVVQSKDTYSTAYDIIPKFNKEDSFTYHFDDAFKSPLLESDVVLIYLQTGLTTNGSPIWKLLTYTEYPNNGADKVEYSYDFSKVDIGIDVRSTNGVNLDNNPGYYTNKKFRVVIVPAKTGTSKNAAFGEVDYSNYNSVIKYYNINESKISTKY
ncbi:hypothetical protein CQ046_21890 [Chryseobacterium sp. MYb7]|uniref:hypothetical protein n=1 Tax=Chryseobacterium sp. MYb7 TaxID=1827290 RepID=UPI000CFF4BE8|nr:hypothetical protein [Chryseobacterium sp. MYb7]PRA95690.1 hypothetical protein CQ046_21890 [Chryseobacterium sp. MYb7]